MAIAVLPNAVRLERSRSLALSLLSGSPAPPGGEHEWREALVEQLAFFIAAMELPGDWLPALSVPRSVHGQSQGIAEIFGARVQKQSDGYYYVHPLLPDPALIGAIELAPLEQSMYWGAVEWMTYARASIRCPIVFRIPVMTGPMDTATLLLGATTLLEWVYTQPDVLHQLLGKTTDVAIRMVTACRAAAGELACGHIQCLRGCFDLCSEVRSLVSTEVYEEFEAPYLRELGATLGPYGIHSCGSWERTIPSALADPNLRVMHGQIRENDLPTLCRLAQGRVALAIGPSVNLDPQYTWAEIADFYRYILETVPDDQPFEVVVSEDDLALWLRLCTEIRGDNFPLNPPLLGDHP